MLRVGEGLIGLALQSGVQALPPAVGQALRALGGGALPRAAAAVAASLGVAAARPLSTTASCCLPVGRYQPTTRNVMDDDELGPSTSPPRNGSTVVLVSGGIEAAALLSYWCHWDHAPELLPLFVEYGQKNARAEEAAQQAMCRHLGLQFNAINASMVAHQLNMAASGRRYHDPLPHRNLLLLSLAASFAADTKASNVAICLTKDDLGNYSSATMPFIRHVEGLYETLDPPVSLAMPLLGLRKEQVLDLGEQVKAPWHLTYTCAEGKPTPCGKCGPCTVREEAFDKADLKDPLLQCKL